MLDAMRRPLGTGMPFEIVNAAANPVDVTVFDTNTVDTSHAYEVTLYGWPGVYVADAYDTFYGFDIVLVSSGVEVVLVSITDVAAVAYVNFRVVSGAAWKLIDKLVLRGDQQLLVRPLTGGAGTNTWAFYGYFEQDAHDPEPYTFRPLQPSTPLVSPFNGTPTTLTIPSGDPAAHTNAHLLNADYFDYVTMWASAAMSSGEGLGDDSRPVVTFPNGVVVSLPGPQDSSGLTIPILLFDGIPFLAPTAANNAITIGATASDSAGDLVVTAWGQFTRGT
jgi:hypothetical protein